MALTLLLHQRSLSSAGRWLSVTCHALWKAIAALCCSSHVDDSHESGSFEAGSALGFVRTGAASG